MRFKGLGVGRSGIEIGSREDRRRGTEGQADLRFRKLCRQLHNRSAAFVSRLLSGLVSISLGGFSLD